MSKRQEKHTHSTLSWQVRQAVLDALSPHLQLGIQGRNLDDEKTFDILMYASATGTTIESACNELADTPSGNTVRDHLQNALGDTLVEVILKEDALNQALRSQLPDSLRRGFARKAYEIAIDLTEIPYHGQPAKQDGEVRRGKAKSGTTHFHTYATLAVVRHKRRYELALTFVWKDDSMNEVVQRLVQQALSIGVQIKRAYLDKGFCQTDVLRFLRAHRIPYLIPIPKRGRSGGIRDLFVGRKSYRSVYTFYENTFWAYTTDVILIRRLVRGHYTWMAFAVYRVDHIPLHQIFDLYRRRFGIETGYRQIHHTRARTTSRNPVLRLVLMGLAMILFNAYITFRQSCQTTRQYGSRIRKIWLTLNRMHRLLIRWFEHVFGVTPIEQT